MSKIIELVVEMRPCNPAILSAADQSLICNNPQPNPQAMSLQDYPLVMTPAEAAQALGIGKNSIYALLRSGALKSLRVGRLIKITRSALEEYLQNY